MPDLFHGASIEGEQTQLSLLINDILIAIKLLPLSQPCPRTDNCNCSVHPQLNPFIHSAPRYKGGNFKTPDFLSRRVIGFVNFENVKMLAHLYQKNQRFERILRNFSKWKSDNYKWGFKRFFHKMESEI